VRSMGRVTAGVRGINLRKGDFVEEVAIFDPAEESDILVVSELGFGKRTALSEFRIQGRGGFGMKLIRLSDKTGAAAAILHAHEDDEILVVTEGGMLIRMNVDEIRRIGRATQGVRIIRLKDGDRVVSVARTERSAEDDEAEFPDDSEDAEEIEETDEEPTADGEGA
jgi:DNA gyrase subunit A